LQDVNLLDITRAPRTNVIQSTVTLDSLPDLYTAFNHAHVRIEYDCRPEIRDEGLFIRVTGVRFQLYDRYDFNPGESFTLPTVSDNVTMLVVGKTVRGLFGEHLVSESGSLTVRDDFFVELEASSSAASFTVHTEVVALPLPSDGILFNSTGYHR
jgi:hypothetical protein